MYITSYDIITFNSFYNIILIILKIYYYRKLHYELCNYNNILSIFPRRLIKLLRHTSLHYGTLWNTYVYLVTLSLHLSTTSFINNFFSFTKKSYKSCKCE